MRILYHHRTRSTDAQRIHIQEIVRAFEALGHSVEIVSLVPIDAAQHDATRDAGEAWWKPLVRRLPFGYELVQLGYNIVGLPILITRMRRFRPDLVYERYSLFNFSGVLASRIFRLPIVLEVNSPFALEQSRDRDIRLTWLASWAERTICNMASRVVVVSTPLARILSACGVKASRIDVMPNGVDLRKFQPGSPSSELRTRLGVDGLPVIGFVGWFRKWHGLEMLLEAFHLAGLRGRAKVLLVGGGQEMANLQRLVSDRGFDGSVIFTGPLPHTEVPGYIDLIDIAVQPAANEYCCPMKILEYMAAGKAIVAPRQENVLELLHEGREAEYFSPGDPHSLASALLRLVDDPQTACRMGQSARAAITQRGYLWTTNALRVLERFEKQTDDDNPCLEATSSRI